MPPGVPVLAPLEDLTETRFCQDDSGVVICQPGPSPCGPGRMPAAGSGDACIDVGVPWSCPPGFIVDPKRKSVIGTPTPCVADPALCTSAPWGGKPPGVDALHVKMGAPANGDGSADAPFASLVDALSAAKPGATLALHPGDYAGPVVIDKTLHIRGRCAAQVKLQATTGQAALTVSVNGSAAAVELAGLSVAGQVPGLRITGGKVRARHLNIHSALHFGVWLSGGGLELRDSQVRDTRSLAGKGQEGYGIFVAEKARARLDRVRLSGNRGAGLSVTGAGTVVVAHGLAIDHTGAAQVTKVGGQGLAVSHGARVRVLGARLTANRIAGINVGGKGSRLDLAGARVEGTLVAESAPIAGVGIAAGDGASLTLTGSLVIDNRYVGVALQEAADPVRVVGTRIESTASALRKTDGLGTGISINRGSATSKLIASLFVANHAAGIAVTEARARIDGCVIYNTQPALMPVERGRQGRISKDVELSDGIVGHASPSLAISHTLVQQHLRAGVLLDGNDLVHMKQCQVSGGTFGLVTQGAGKVDAQSSLIVDNDSNLVGDQVLFVAPAPSVDGL